MVKELIDIQAAVRVQQHAYTNDVLDADPHTYCRDRCYSQQKEMLNNSDPRCGNGAVKHGQE